LYRAQSWLRTATNADLQVYARTAARTGRIEQGNIAGIERELSAEGLAVSRNAAAIEWVTPAAGQATPGDSRNLARPYVHPYSGLGSSIPVRSIEPPLGRSTARSGARNALTLARSAYRAAVDTHRRKRKPSR